MLEHVRVVVVKRRRCIVLKCAHHLLLGGLGSTGLREVLLSQDSSSHPSLPSRLSSQRQICSLFFYSLPVMDHFYSKGSTLTHYAL